VIQAKHRRPVVPDQRMKAQHQGARPADFDFETNFEVKIRDLEIVPDLQVNSAHQQADYQSLKF
jgi:hypothetical protein